MSVWNSDLRTKQDCDQVTKLTPVRVGFVSAEYITATRMEALPALPGISIGAVIDPNLGAAKRLVRKVTRARDFYRAPHQDACRRVPPGMTLL